jgi:hypothetical protein
MSDEEGEGEVAGRLAFLHFIRQLLEMPHDSDSDSGPHHEYSDSESAARRPQDDQRSQEEIDIERAIALSIQDQQHHDVEADEYERLIEASERESRETEEIRAFISDPVQLYSVLDELPGVDSTDPCFDVFLA